MPTRTYSTHTHRIWRLVWNECLHIEMPLTGGPGTLGCNTHVTARWETSKRNTQLMLTLNEKGRGTNDKHIVRRVNEWALKVNVSPFLDRNTPPSPQTFLQIVTKSVKTARTPFNKRMHGKLENYREIRIIFATAPRDLQVVLYVDNSRHSSLKKREREGKSKGKKTSC